MVWSFARRPVVWFWMLGVRAAHLWCGLWDSSGSPEAPICHFFDGGHGKGRIRHFLRKKGKNSSFSSFLEGKIRFFRLHMCPYFSVSVCR